MEVKKNYLGQLLLQRLLCIISQPGFNKEWLLYWKHTIGMILLQPDLILREGYKVLGVNTSYAVQRRGTYTIV